MIRLNFQIPSRAANVTPSDTTDVSGTVAFVATSAGTVSVETEGGDIANIGVSAGETIWIRVKRIRLTSTTATGIVRFFGP